MSVRADDSVQAAPTAAEEALRRERTAREEAERSAARLLRLHEVAAALTPSLPEEEVFALLLRSAIEIGGAVNGNIMVPDVERGIVRLTHEHGMEPARASRWREFSLGAKVPMANVLRTGQPEWIPDGATYAAAYPEVVGGDAPLGPATQAIAALPIVGAQGIVAGLGLGFGVPREFTLEEKGFLIALTRLGGQAIDRARLFRDRERAREAERVQLSRARLLADASRYFAEAGSTAELILSELARRVVHDRIVETCSVRTFSADGTALIRVAVEADRAILPQGMPVASSVPVSLEPYATVARTGLSV